MANLSLPFQQSCQLMPESDLPLEGFMNVSIFDRYEFTAFRKQFLSLAYRADTILTPIYIILGLFGDSISFFVWSRRKLYRNNSSAIYLAVVSLSDLCFLLFYLLQHLQRIWFIKVIDYPLWCPIFQVFFLTFQYLPISLTLTFTAERWFAICYPFMRDVWCTPRRACLISAIVASATFLLASVNFFFWEYKAEKKQCVPLFPSFKTEYSIFEQTVISAVLPICTLVMNLLVIRELRRITHSHHTVVRNRAAKAAEQGRKPSEVIPNYTECRKHPIISVTECNSSTNVEYHPLNNISSNCDTSAETSSSVNDRIKRRSSARASVYSSSGKTPLDKGSSRSESSAFRSTTIMLLMVSFYLILCTLPAGAVLTLQSMFTNGPECISDEYVHRHAKWRRFLIAQNIKEYVDQFSVSHYAGNFIIYLATHVSYRLEFLRLLTCGLLGSTDPRDELQMAVRTRLSPSVNPACGNGGRLGQPDGVSRSAPHQINNGRSARRAIR